MMEPITTTLAVYGLRTVLNKLAEPVLEKLPKISLTFWKALSQSDIPDWKIEYLRKLIEESEYLGGREANRYQERPALNHRKDLLQYHLSAEEAFLPPRLKRRTPQAEIVSGVVRMDEADEVIWTQALIQTLEQWPEESPFIPAVLVHGAPGVGKSTLLRVLAGKLARLWLFQAGLSHQITAELPDDLQVLLKGLDEIPFPLLLDFASLDDRDIKRVIPDHLDRMFEAEIDKPTFPPDVADQLFEGELLICLDAVDQELDLTAREEKLGVICTWSAGLRRRSTAKGEDADFRQMLVIANRTAAELPGLDGEFGRQGLAYWQIPPLDDETTPPFIGHWLNAYFKRRGESPKGDELAAITALVDQLRGHSTKAGRGDGTPFPTSQLHLDLVCRLYMADPVSTTHITRGQVFAKLIELALQSWEKERVGERSDSLRRYCGYLAVQAMGEGITGGGDEEGKTIDEETLERWTQGWLRAEGVSEWRGEELIALLANDLGFILRVRSHGQYRFTHMQFQEYLAAARLLDTEEFNHLASEGDGWLATASFVFESLRDGQTDALLEALMQRGGLQSEQRKWLEEIERWGRPFLQLAIADRFHETLLDESHSPRDRAWAAIWFHRLRMAAGASWSWKGLQGVIDNPALDELAQAHLLMLLPESSRAEWREIIDWLKMQLTGDSEAYLNHCRALTLSMLGYGWATGEKTQATAREERQRLDGYLYVQMEGGEFQMGHADESGNRPRTGISKPCRMRRFPITRAEYARFMETAAFQSFLRNRGKTEDSDRWDQPRYWGDPDYTHPGAPVVGVSWLESRACAHALLAEPDEPLPPPSGQADTDCPWLPRETEWERAASWDAKRGLAWEYPWGDWKNDSPQHHCNIDDSNLKQTSPVVAFPAGVSPGGCYEMSGNVWEWQANWYDNDEDFKSLRGGAFYGLPRGARCAYRSINHPVFWNSFRGFRVARTDF